MVSCINAEPLSLWSLRWLGDHPLPCTVLRKVFELNGLSPDLGGILDEKVLFSKNSSRKVFKVEYLARPGMPGRELIFGVAPCVYYMGCVKGRGGLGGRGSWVRALTSGNRDKGGIRAGCLGYGSARKVRDVGSVLRAFWAGMIRAEGERESCFAM